MPRRVVLSFADFFGSSLFAAFRPLSQVDPGVLRRRGRGAMIDGVQNNRESASEMPSRNVTSSKVESQTGGRAREQARHSSFLSSTTSGSERPSAVVATSTAVTRRREREDRKSHHIRLLLSPRISSSLLPPHSTYVLLPLNPLATLTLISSYCLC